MIKLLMSRGAQHDVRNKDGQTPLHSASFPGRKEAVACLLDRGNELLVLKGADMKMKQSKGLTALDMAAFKGHDKVVDFLINAGARFDEGGTVAKNCNACGKEDPDNTRLKKFQMEEQAKNELEGAGPSSSPSTGS